jgi:hypothetical protein
MSKTLNSNFRCKIGRTLYGWSGMVRILGVKLAEHILMKAMRSKNQVFRYKATKAGVIVCLYSK